MPPYSVTRSLCQNVDILNRLVRSAHLLIEGLSEKVLNPKDLSRLKRECELKSQQKLTDLSIQLEGLHQAAPSYAEAEVFDEHLGQLIEKDRTEKYGFISKMLDQFVSTIHDHQTLDSYMSLNRRKNDPSVNWKNYCNELVSDLSVIDFKQLKGQKSSELLKLRKLVYVLTEELIDHQEISKNLSLLSKEDLRNSWLEVLQNLVQVMRKKTKEPIKKPSAETILQSLLVFLYNDNHKINQGFNLSLGTLLIKIKDYMKNGNGH